LVEHPDEPKYRKINTQSAVYGTKIQAYNGAPEVLRLVGFRPADDGMFLVLLPESVNASLLKQALKKLRNILLSP
jgi:hypothetical protein